MDKLRKRNNSNMYKELTAVSDNTRVSSPYRIQQQVESTTRRKPINVRDAVLKFRQQEEKEARERADEERRRNNAEYYQKKQQEKQA